MYAEPMATREECNSTLAVGGLVGAEESGHGGSNSIDPPGGSQEKHGLGAVLFVRGARLAA